MVALAPRPCRSHFTSEVYPDLDCRESKAKTMQDPPLLFDLYRDASEVYRLTPADPGYNQTLSIITEVLWAVLHNYVL